MQLFFFFKDLQLAVSGGTRAESWALYLCAVLLPSLHLSLPICEMGRELDMMTSQLPVPTMTSRDCRMEPRGLLLPPM